MPEQVEREARETISFNVDFIVPWDTALALESSPADYQDLYQRIFDLGNAWFRDYRERVELPPSALGPQS